MNTVINVEVAGDLTTAETKRVVDFFKLFTNVSADALNPADDGVRMFLSYLYGDPMALVWADEVIERMTRPAGEKFVPRDEVVRANKRLAARVGELRKVLRHVFEVLNRPTGQDADPKTATYPTETIVALGNRIRAARVSGPDLF